MENYILQNNLRTRQNFTRLRISTHKLAIETGRHKRPKINVEERICVHCNQQKVEDEFHFIMECGKYSVVRDQLFTSLNDFTSFQYINIQKQFCILMNCNYGDSEFSAIVCDFVNSCFNIRNS